MSIIDTAAHSVVAYDPKSSKAFTGQRLSKVQYKTTTDKDSPEFGIKRPSMCVSLPLVPVDEVIANAAVLAPVVADYLQTVQDKMIKEMIEAGQKSISTESISIPAILEWLESNNDSGRITKEVVSKWFADNIADNLAVVLAEKLGVGEVPTEAESKQVMNAVAVFQDKVAALAGGKTSYPEKVAESLKKVMALADSGDAMASKFTARLDKMIADSKKVEELVDLL